ncbi:trace amine-associated receptor 7a-like [Protopterus annectens]|uniref:trace amine-associated receptor 7a-like n=1 Tax=Protopterus annectens TaxID=7888 RepID=UPI001CF992F1|nr:trace amine-associated receptor 7a-like [Protopterus annectens]
MNVTAFQIKEQEMYCYSELNRSCTKRFHSFAVQVVLYILFSVGTVLTITGNVMVIISICHFKQLQSPTHFLILSLATADFLLGLTVLPFSAVRAIDTCWYFGDAFCTFHTSLDGTICITSILHLCIIAIDRYFAITYPLIYPIKFTACSTALIITFVWIVSLTYTFSLLYSGANKEGLEEIIAATSCKGSCQILINAKWGLVNLLLFFIPFSLMAWMYTRIFMVVRNQARLIESLTDETFAAHNYNSRVAKRERKAAKTLGIAMVAFVICWLPFFIASILDSYLNFILPPFAFDIILGISYFNSALNPLIYAMFYPWFRKSIKLILSCKVFTADCSTTNLFNQ